MRYFLVRSIVMALCLGLTLLMVPGVSLTPLGQDWVNEASIILVFVNLFRIYVMGLVLWAVRAMVWPFFLFLSGRVLLWTFGLFSS